MVLFFEQLNDEQRADLWASLALQCINGLGVNRRKRLVDFFGSPYRAILGVKDWCDSGLGIRHSSAEEFMRNGWRAQAKEAWEKIKEVRAGILLYSDARYPEQLKEISDAPLFLFYMGDLSLLQNASVAVVGARNCTREGLAVTIDIVRDLSKAGVTAISGLAKGIDRAVHLAGLEAVGSSVAVLGSGIDVPYPAANLDLYKLMAEKGLLISEFLPGTAPIAMNFPIRNRIISGLGKAVLVVEAALRSGTLITARHAVEQNREVFAVPGSTLAGTSEGCRELIRKGARPVFSAEDILRELEPILRPELALKYLEKHRKKINDECPPTGVAVDDPLKSSRQGILPWTNSLKSDIVVKPDSGAEPPPSARSARVDGASLAESERTVLEKISGLGECHIEELASELDTPVAKLSGLLAMLEVKGFVKRLPGMFYCAS